MTKTATAAEAQNTAAYFVTFHECFGIDEDGFVTLPNGERLTIKDGETAHPVAIYQDPMPSPDATGTYWALNPFSTKSPVSPAMRLMFRADRHYMSALLLDLVKLTVLAVLNNKKIHVKHPEFEEVTLNLPLRELAAKFTTQNKGIAGEIDEKTFHEVLTLYDDRVISEFVQRLFVFAKMSTHINIPFLNNIDWFKNTFDIDIRKKTLYVVQAIILHALGVKDGKEVAKVYVGTQETGEPANFSSGMRLFYKIHEALNPYFEGLIDKNTVDLDLLKEQIGNIKACTKRARLMTADKVTKHDTIKEVAPPSAPARTAPVNTARPPLPQQAAPAQVQPPHSYMSRPMTPSAPMSGFQAPQPMRPPMTGYSPNMMGGHAVPPMNGYAQAPMPNRYPNQCPPPDWMRSPMPQPQPKRSITTLLNRSAPTGYGIAPNMMERERMIAQNNQYNTAGLNTNNYPGSQYGSSFSSYAARAPFIRG